MNPVGFRHTLTSAEGAVFYRKLRNPIRDDTARRVIDTNKVEWQPFGHRAAEVVHFYRDPHGIEFSRFGEVFPNQQIPSHDHAIGEETLIVDGVLKDQRGSYGPGTWMRFPIGLEHAPFTEQQSCKMFIRDGDLVW
jgi:anti-sigma factor ChrR (cupin superfamily)